MEPEEYRAAIQRLSGVPYCLRPQAYQELEQVRRSSPLPPHEEPVAREILERVGAARLTWYMKGSQGGRPVTCCYLRAGLEWTRAARATASG